MRLTILRGVPASGKSTFAMTEPDSVRVNRDDIRHALYGRYWGGNIDEDVVTQVEDAAIEAGLRAGSDVVVDATNLERKRLKTKLSLANTYGADVVIKDFPVSMDLALSRDRERGIYGRSVGDSVIKNFFRRYKINPETGVLPAAPEPLPEFEPYVKPPRWASDAYIFDIDGTLANHEGVRNPYDTSKYHLDTGHMHVIRTAYALAQTYDIIVLSGRDEEFRPQTRRWLDDNGVEFTALHMRPKGDRRIDALVKYELFKEKIEPEYNVLGVFDDRPQVLRMWRTIGVPTFNVGDGKEF